MSEKRDWGWLYHGLAVLAVAVNAGLWIGREALQNGGIAGMGYHSWIEAIVPAAGGFVCMVLIVAIVDLNRGKKL